MARLRAGVRDERGATAVFFAVGLLLLAPATLGLVDIYLTSTQRGQLQDAVDAATLYAARSEEMTSEGVDRVGDAALLANLKLPQGQQVTFSEFKLDGVKITGTVKITPPSIGPDLWTKADLQAESVVVRNSNNVEVALVLDTTGSMDGQMGNLKTAANELIDLVVKDKDHQKPYYTKLALVPYSVGVNVGANAEKARGTPRAATAISGAERTNPLKITSTAHGLKTGDRVRISGVGGMTRLNDKDYTVTRIDDTRFTLNGIDGTEKKDGSYRYQNYTGGGSALCLNEGCATQSFKNLSNDWTKFGATNCVTERVVGHKYDDAEPGTAKVGWHYAGSCPSAEVMPLTIDKDALKGRVNSLSPSGSTAGHIGLAWGWYMVSPAWKTLWTGDSAPAAYDTPQTVKVVILMTDGAFNTPYCKGVAAKDAGSGAPNGDSRINCDATNGNAFDQAEELCKQMKLKKVVVYTVGFNVGNDQDVKDLMDHCATDLDHRYLPANGVALKDAFRAIGQDINSLRIAK